jgi:hypothetical protein
MASKPGRVDEGKSGSPRPAATATAAPRRGLVAKVESYFYENDDFAKLFERFAEEHAAVIDLGAAEFKLEYTDVYNKFLALFESSLSQFIEEQGGTIEAFYDEVREGFEADEEGDVAQFAKIMMATCDFDIFMMLMRETAETWQRKRGAEGKQSGAEATEDKVAQAAAADYGRKCMPGDAI